MSAVESVVHELAHAVCLGMDREPGFEKITDLSEAIAGRIEDLDKDNAHLVWGGAQMWQEILALAVEVLVLQRLRIRVWRCVVSGAAMRDSMDGPDGAYWTYMKFVSRALRWKTTRQRARRALQVLDEFCERGLRAQGEQGMDT